MIKKDRIPNNILPILEENLQEHKGEILFPPPVFEAMKGEVVSYDSENEILTNKFPVLHRHLNPYGNMQGGIISAAIDNTIGPLSMLISPPNFTRYLKVKYAKIISPELNYIYVIAKFTRKKKRFLFFEAVVQDYDGTQLASAESTHWIID